MAVGLRQTGEVYFRDEAGGLFLAMSWVDDIGVVTTTVDPVAEDA